MDDMTTTAEDWYRIYEYPENLRGKGPAFLINLAGRKARQYVDDGSAYADVQPGNGYKYDVVLHDLLTVQALELDKKERLNRDRSEVQPMDELRKLAANMGPAALMGGDLLVAIPGFHKSLVLAGDGFHTPDYIEEKVKLGMIHSVPLAIFLSAFSEALGRLR